MLRNQQKNKKDNKKKKQMKKVFKVYSMLVLGWIFMALSIEMYMVYLHFTNQTEAMKSIANRISKNPFN